MKRIFLLTTLCLLGCSSFAYKYYGVQWAERSDDVRLLSADPKDDKPFTICKPSEDDLGKCVVVPASEWFKLQRDFQTMRARIRELERSCQK